MTIRWRLGLSFLLILALFGLNLVIYFWSDQRRNDTVMILRQATSRQMFIASIKQKLNDLQKQVALLNQVMVEAPTGGIGPEEILLFDGQLAGVAEQIAELRKLSATGSQVESLDDVYQKLSASWRIFYKNFGVHHTQAITELAIRASVSSLRAD